MYNRNFTDTGPENFVHVHHEADFLFCMLVVVHYHLLFCQRTNQVGSGYQKAESWDVLSLTLVFLV